MSRYGKTTQDRVGGPYAYYTLAVLVAVYTISQTDRLILSILAEDVKADLGVSDSQIGFLFGTAFGVFYAIFGVTLGRLADFLPRKNLLAIGIALWSVLTFLSGMANNFAQFALARTGIGIGEATAQPCAQSILTDRFPKERRALVLGICISGLAIGAGLSKFAGGWILSYWTRAYPTNPPLGLAAWQVAFYVMGLPGLIIALLVFFLREPVRGVADNLPPPPPEPHPFIRTIAELSSAIPPLTLLRAARQGGKALSANLLAIAAALLLAICGGTLFDDWVQWIALAIGLYSAFSWAQALRHNDGSTYKLIFRTPAFITNAVGYSLISLVNWSIMFWAAPYAIRMLDANPATVGLVAGVVAAGCGLAGAISGGRLGDYLRTRTPGGRTLVGLISVIVTAPIILVMLHVASLTWFFILFAAYYFFANMWLGTAAATAHDLVLPHMRGAAAATNILGFTLLGLCIGPYAVGKMSVVLGDLRLAMSLILVALPFAAALLWHNFRTFPHAEATKVARAAA